jgi:hypothetical protein
VARTVYLVPGDRPAEQAHQLRGTSFGRWEQGSLAIFTLYIDYPYFDRFGTPQSRDVTVLERYTPDADFARLDWEATVTDEATFSAPIVRLGHYSFEPGAVFEPSNCPLAESATP